MCVFNNSLYYFSSDCCKVIIKFRMEGLFIIKNL